jgi:hypothetical protein
MQSLAETNDAAETVEHAEAVGGGRRHQHATVIGAQVERRKGWPSNAARVSRRKTEGVGRRKCIPRLHWSIFNLGHRPEQASWPKVA